ncbi:hypothetical protein HYW99_00530, partial [Candidatus Woesearchaeota archaeon]|nr:hypothetical protein [Candidatus Woesearchaeota archaeon]
MKTPKKEHNVLLLSIVIVIAIVMLFLTFSKIDKSRYVTKLDLVGGATSTSGEHNTFSGSPTTYKQLGVSSYYMQLVQSFVLPSTSTLKSVKLGLARQGNPNYPITVSIRKGSPIGNDIFTPVTIPLQSLQQISTDYRNPSWIEVAMPSFTLNGGTTYYLALKVTQSDSGDYYRWSATSNTYSSGVLYRITSSGKVYDYSNDALATILYTTTSSPPPPPPSTCSDGTAKNQCSSTKPLYCNTALQLVNNCGSCGCSAGYTCQSDGACVITPITQTLGIQTIDNIPPDSSNNFMIESGDNIAITSGDNIVVSPSVNGIKIDANTLSASSIQINVRDFGAVPDDDIDDTSA